MARSPGGCCATTASQRLTGDSLRIALPTGGHLHIVLRTEPETISACPSAIPGVSRVATDPALSRRRRTGRRPARTAPARPRHHPALPAHAHPRRHPDERGAAAGPGRPALFGDRPVLGGPPV